ncbi:MAG: DUF2095 family protein [Candidatus Bathyarchaeota archaeon]|nr:MAG: DUF2095 family protein [Candidatus Bathyarchaeota archaeon]
MKEMLPHLAEELEGKDHKTSTTSFRLELQTEEKASLKKSHSYVPDAVDYICRCDNNQQAEEIICYLENRGDINCEYARRLRRQLREKGLRSFGSKREEDYYLKQGVL